MAVVLGIATTQEGVSLKIGQTLNQGTQVQTGPTSLLKLVLRDDSIIDMGSSSRLRIASCEGKNWATRINLELENGELRAVVNKAARAKRQEFKVKTLTSILAVRGTEFFMSWQQNADGQVSEQVGVTEGRVEVKSLFDDSFKPVAISSGTEFRAEGRVERTETGELKVEASAPPKLDQFTADEQRQFEQKTKTEEKVFEKSVDLSTDSGTGKEAKQSETAAPAQEQPTTAKREETSQPAKSEKVAQFISATLQAPSLEKRASAFNVALPSAESGTSRSARELSNADDIETPAQKTEPSREVASESIESNTVQPTSERPVGKTEPTPSSVSIPPSEPARAPDQAVVATAPTSSGVLPGSVLPGSSFFNNPIPVSVPVIVHWGVKKSD